MAIPVANIQEKCCDNDLSQFNVIDGDSLDSVGSTCDKIIECSNKYILVEEKSIVMAFLDNCCREQGIDLDTKYKFTNNGIEHINISLIINEVIHGMNQDVKERILSDTIMKLIITSAKKASNTTDILNKTLDKSKTANMTTLYLYCNSGKPVDSIINTWLSRYRKDLFFIECQTLKRHLSNAPC